MCLNFARDEFERFRRLGVNVLIPEYVGYGMSGGKPSERGCRGTADAAYEYLVRTRGIEPGGSSRRAGRSAGPSPSTWPRAGPWRD